MYSFIYQESWKNEMILFYKNYKYNNYYTNII